MQFTAPLRISVVLSVFVCTVCSASAQYPADAPLKIGSVVFSGSVRTRVEGWNWFGDSGQNSYGYSETVFRFGFSERTKNVDWAVEFAAPVLIGLPGHAIAPGAQGQLGFGGTYFAVDNRQTNYAFVFPKQAYLRFHGGSRFQQSLLMGRQEYFDGLELAPEDATLTALDKDRIAQRLLGNFAFTVTGRSLDGGFYSAGTKTTNVTALGARPTRGVFQVDGWGEVNADVGYLAVSHLFGSGNYHAQVRVFALQYNDFRNNVLKTDNRPRSVRAADHKDIDIQSYGADYIDSIKTGAGTFDVLGWGVLQTGTWGTLRHRADAYAAEGGWQPSIAKLRPWLRGGYDYSSGDKNPNDSVHGTFFPILPTPRVYARFPFFNMMNNRDVFGELILRPAKKWTVRSDVHSLALANKNDLWYSGGGAFQPWTFGYTGRPSGGHAGFATLFDISGDYTYANHTSFTLYYGHASGKLVPEALYPKGPNANLGLVEINYRF